MSVLPSELYLGKVSIEWPLYVFESRSSAMRWLRDAAPNKRRQLWHVSLVGAAIQELKVVEPEPFLTPVEGEPAT